MGFLSNLLSREAKKLASDVISNVGDSLKEEFNIPTKHQTATASGYAATKKEQDGEAGFGAKKYSYGLYYNGQPKAMMMVLTDRNEYRKKSVMLSKDACYEKGVAYMNFMSHLPNRTDYISRRLRENIG